MFYLMVKSRGCMFTCVSRRGGGRKRGGGKSSRHVIPSKLRSTWAVFSLSFSRLHRQGIKIPWEHLEFQIVRNFIFTLKKCDLNFFLWDVLNGTLVICNILKTTWAKINWPNFTVLVIELFVTNVFCWFIIMEVNLR